MDEVITLQFDGGSRGNPGPAGIGVVLRAEDGTPLVTLGRFIGRATNNVAEYKALITALEQAKRLGAKKVVVRGDSELIVKQMRGEYRVRNPDLRELYDEAQYLLSQFEKSKIEHNYRESNALADKLANLAMDRRQDVMDVDDPGPGGRAPPVAAAPSTSRAGASHIGDSPQGRPPPGRARPEVTTKAPRAAAAVTTGALPLIGSAYACPRCGCAVRVTHPSSKPPDEVGAFLCVCGIRMEAQESGG